MTNFLDQQQIAEILKQAQKGGAQFAEVFIEDKTTCLISADGGKIEQLNQGAECGLGLRLIDGDKVAYASTNELNYKNLLKIANDTARALKGDCQNISLHFDRPQKHTAPVVTRPFGVDSADKIELVRQADRAACADNRISRAMVGYSDSTQHVLIANSNGVWVDDERIRSRLSVTALAKDNSETQSGFATLGAAAGFELFSDDAATEIGKQAARKATNLLNAKACPGGKMPVVMAAEAGGTMVHEACGHGLEGDLVEKGFSAYKDKLGETVAASGISVIDDATMSGHYGYYAYDDEGQAAQKNVLIRDGVLEQYMYDYHTACKVGTKSTANGRRQSYRHKPVTRMSNTIIAPGTDDPAEIIASVKHGLLVTKMGGGQVNTLTGDYVFDVSEGYMLLDGEIAYQVRGATLAGNGPQSLCDVSMIGRDLGFAIGTCGKSGQSAPVSDGQPTMKIDNLVVGGTAGDFTIERR